MKAYNLPIIGYSSFFFKVFLRFFRDYSDKMNKKSAEILDNLWIELYMRGE